MKLLKCQCVSLIHENETMYVKELNENNVDVMIMYIPISNIKYFVELSEDEISLVLIDNKIYICKRTDNIVKFIEENKY